MIEDTKVRRAIGAAEYKKYVASEDLTATESVLAMCYLCTGFYADGKVDCHADDGPTKCPLYGRMPYRDIEEGKIRKTVKVMPRSCARCEFPKDRERTDYTCSLGKPQLDREGRLFPVNDACFQNRRVRGGKGDTP